MRVVIGILRRWPLRCCPRWGDGVYEWGAGDYGYYVAWACCDFLELECEVTLVRLSTCLFVGGLGLQMEGC